MGFIYEITCDGCRDPVYPYEPVIKDSNQPGNQPRYNYVGKTATSLHCRMTSHLDGRRRKQGSNALFRHDLEVHAGTEQSYSTRILTRERTNLPLNIIEGLYIEKQKIGTSLNGKNESGRGSIVRLVATRVNA